MTEKNFCPYIFLFLNNLFKTKYGIAAIDIPPPKEPKPEITVRGPQKGAVAAAAELRELIKRKESKCKSVNITIEKKQHKFVIGPKGRNIQDVMEKCNVAVEVPSQEDNSNVITLRGEQQDMGAAITAVYGYASSHQDAFIACDEWMHRLLIGQKEKLLHAPLPITCEFFRLRIQIGAFMKLKKKNYPQVSLDARGNILKGFMQIFDQNF